MRHPACRRSMLLLTTQLLALSLLGSQPVAAQSRQPKTPPLTTPWTAQVTATNSYEMQPDSAALTNRYLGLVAQTRQLMDSLGLSAAVSTEIVDVENEINGMQTYDRAVIKVDVARVKAAHDALVNASRSLNGPLRLGQLQSLQVAFLAYPSSTLLLNSRPGWRHRFEYLSVMVSIGLIALLD